MKTVRICLWSGPRNISTALMYSFAQREDTMVLDEPLYAHYLASSEKELVERHPVAQVVLDTMENDGAKVIEMMMGEFPSEVVFFKNMTHHLLDLDRSYMDGVVNVILTRDPFDMLPSFAKVIKDPTMADVGYEAHIELLDSLLKRGIEPIIIDSKNLLLNPRVALTKLCDLAGIAFDEIMLKWDAGARAEDGAWAEYWYSGTHQSTGFQKYLQKAEPFPNKLRPLLQACQPCYDTLINRMN